jgi:hypothetical protein
VEEKILFFQRTRVRKISYDLTVVQLNINAGSV